MGPRRGDIDCPLPPSDPDSVTASKSADSERRVQAVVALRLLEVIRDQDVPADLFEDENPAQTMPRRLGLSDVVERQIRAYREDVRKRVRLADHEIRDLFRLVIRRPDGDEVFTWAGKLLAGMDRPTRWSRMLPRKLQFVMARSRVSRRLKNLFGRRVGGFGRGSFSIEGRSLIFIEADPGGDACFFVSGLCQEILNRTTGGIAEVRHSLCQSRGDDRCRWEGEILEGPMEVSPDMANSSDAYSESE